MSGVVPAPLDRLVGRQEELTRLGALHGTARLITVRGPGGAGKTRLAQEYAAGVPGAYWVELAALGDPALLAPAVAAAVGVPERPGRSVPESIAAALAGRRALLVLDNCEHLVDACAVLVNALLTRCADLTVLTTSREALDVPGEAVLRLGALSLPGPGDAATPDALLRSDAVRLFVARAGAVAHRFTLTDENAAVVAGICERLDGHALSIELAARRIRMLDPVEILRRIDDRFTLLAGTRRYGRHRDLHTAIGWSYDLLDEDEKAAFRRLSVLAGGFDLAGAGAVTGFGADVPDVVGGLEAKSLLVAGPANRFRQLESIRLYAQERLLAAGELADTRRRMVEWLAGAAEEYAGQSFPTVDVLGRLDAERENLLAALGWEHGHHLLLASALAACWRERGQFGAGRAVLEAALSQHAGGYRSTALAQAAVLATDVGDGARARALATEAVDLDRAAGRPAMLVRSVSRLVGACLAAGDAPAAVAHAREALDLARRHDAEPYVVAACMHNLAYVGMYAGNVAEAAALLAECLPVCRTRPEPWLRVGTLHSAGTVALVRGDLDAAEAYFREALEYATSHLARKIHPIEGLAVIAAHRGDGRRALRLGAACAVLRRQWGMDAPESDGPADPWGERVAAAVGAARAAVGEAAARRAAAEGAALSADDTVAYALTDREPDGPLTARERDVAALVADGLSTREIAARLGIADRTVDAHLDNIRAKLDLSSRTQVATWWARYRSQRS